MTVKAPAGPHGPSLLLIAIVALVVMGFVLGAGLLMAALLSGARISSPGLSQQVAVIQVKGTLGISGADADVITALLEEAEQDPGIGAVVLDIDCPGGMPVATRQIGQRVKRVSEVKPVVAWIGEMGTSGGYWVATASDWVMADPLSTVGSIGVILEVPNLSGLMEKLGVEMTTITGGAYKDIGSPYRNMTDEERRLLESISVQLHEEFVAEVSSNRGMDIERARELSDGQVYLGRKALELGLVDELGTRDEAIEAAADMAGIAPDWFYLEESGFGPLLRQMSSQQPNWLPW